MKKIFLWLFFLVFLFPNISFANKYLELDCYEFKDNFIDSEEYYKLTEKDIKDNNFLKNFSKELFEKLKDEDFKNKIDAYAKNCLSQWIDKQNWKYLFTFSKERIENENYKDMFAILSEDETKKIVVDGGTYNYEYSVWDRTTLSKYWNHIISFYDNFVEPREEYFYERANKYAWFFIDWVKISWTYPNKEWYKPWIIKRTPPYHHDFTFTTPYYLNRFFAPMDKVKNWFFEKWFFLSKTDLKYLNDFLDSFLKNPENYPKIDQIINRLENFKTIEDSYKNEALSYLQAELKIFQLTKLKK